MNILIVDDEEDDRFYLERILRASGHSVSTAKNHTEGVEAFRSDPAADLVITDLRMPDADDGIRLLAEILSINPGARVWLATSHLNDDAEKHSKDLGVEKAIQKMDLRLELWRAGIISDGPSA